MNASRLSANDTVLERRRTIIKEVANSRDFKFEKDGTILTRVDIAGVRVPEWTPIKPAGHGVKFFLHRGVRVQIHLALWVHFKGYLPRNLTVGFRDGDPTNYRLENLWLVPLPQPMPSYELVTANYDALYYSSRVFIFTLKEWASKFRHLAIEDSKRRAARIPSNGVQA